MNIQYLYKIYHEENKYTHKMYILKITISRMVPYTIHDNITYYICYK